MSNKKLFPYLITVKRPCPHCQTSIEYTITFHGTLLDQKEKQIVILDCPACREKEVALGVNIDIKIEKLLSITHNYKKVGPGGETEIHGSTTVTGPTTVVTGTGRSKF